MITPFVVTKDTDDELEWQWKGYIIQWQSLPEDGSWNDEWEYLLTNNEPGRECACGFDSLKSAVAYAVKHDKSATYLETFGGTMRYYDKEIGAWVEKRI